MTKTSQHRHDRLRLHGPGPLQRLLARSTTSSTCQYRPVLKAACARNADKVKAFADQWGYESVETDWRKLIERKDIDADRHLHAEQHARRDRHRRGRRPAR